MIYKIIIILLIICVPMVALSADSKPSKSDLPPLMDVRHKKPVDNSKEIKRIEDYLNNIKTFKASFTQNTSDGQYATGTFYLSRPGRLRWQYDPPAHILIVAKGRILKYYDTEMNEATYVNISDTLAGLLVRKEISFSKDIEIKKIDITDEVIAMKLEQTGKADQGNLILIFNNKEPLTLEEMVVTDSSGTQSLIKFGKPEYNVSMNDDLFSLPNGKF